MKMHKMPILNTTTANGRRGLDLLTRRGFYAPELVPEPHVHQFVLVAGPWPQYQKAVDVRYHTYRAIVNARCRSCPAKGERIIVTKGAWTPKRVNRAMERAGIFWT